MKAKKRFLSLLLCGAMLFSLCPQAAFAEGAEADGLCEHHPQHTAECGYAPGTEGTPCTYVCEICNPQDSGEAEETEPGADCIYTGLCTEETMNAECPVCGAEDADLTACEGVEEETATVSNAPMPLLPTTALAAGEEPSVTLTITSSGGSAVYGTTVSMVATVTNLTSSSQVFVQLFKGTDAQYFAQQPATPMPGTGMLSVTYEVSLTGDTWKPADYNITAKVNINGTTYSSEAVNLKVTKANQSLSVPTASSKTSTSVTLNTVTGQGDVKYACVQGESAAAPAAGSTEWQDTTKFTGLKPATAYTFFAHCAGNDYYNEATSSAVIYTNYAAPTNLNFISSKSGVATASWRAVTGATSYTLQLYKGEQEVGEPVSTNQTGYDFAINGVGAYSFTVKATGEGVDGEVSQKSETSTFYEVKFESNGGTEVSSQYVVRNQRPDKPDDPTKDGYAFGGWYKDNNFNNKWNFADTGGDYVSDNVTLYAKWLSTDADVESVTVNGQSAAAGENNTFSVTLPYGTEITSDTITINLADKKATVSNLQADKNDNSKWTFTVTAEDGQTVENYTINVTFSPVASTLTVVPAEDTLTYGDKLEIKVTPGIAAANALTTAPNTVALYNGDDLLASTTTANADGTYTLTYDTQQKGLTIGENTLTVSFGGDSGLNPSTAPVTVTLKKKQVTATVQSTITKVYDGVTDITISLTFSGDALIAGDTISGFVPSNFNDANVGKDKPITLGDPVWVNGGDAAPYYEITLPADVKGDITKANIDKEVTIQGVARFGETLTAAYAEKDVSVRYQWERNDEDISGAASASYTLTADDVGQSITVTATATDSNHTGSVTSESVTVGKATGSIEIACGDVAYGGTVRPTVTSTTNEGAAVTYTYTGAEGTDYPASTTAPTAPGTYTVTATVAETATHTAAESEPVAFTISKAGLAAPQNLTLASTAPGKATATWEEVQNASGYTVQLYKGGQADGNSITTTGTSHEFSIAEAGSYTVKVKANGDSNHSDSAEVESNNLTFYTVTANGSYAQTSGTDVYIEGATVSIDAGTRAGYTFDGWTSSDGVTFANAGSVQTTFTMPGKPVTVTASWVPNSSEVGDQEFVRYIVQHYKQNTDGSYRLEDAEYPIGKVGETVTAVARNYEGYTYNAEKSNASGTLTEIKSDADIATLKLYYDLTVFTVTVETSGNGTASASPASATMGQTVTLTANAASGYHFVKWEVVSGDIVLNGNIFTMPAGNVTVKAVFERTSSGGEGGTSYDYFTISASAGEGGSISPAGNISVREGLDKTFTITPADGYIISDVRVDGVSVGAVSSYTFDNVQKRHTIEAVFAKENPETGVDNPFTDVHTGDWFYDDVMFVYENGLMVGTSDTTFGPNEAISRAQVAVIFYRMAGSPEVTGESAFTDVVNGPGTAWYYNAVLWAQQNGIVSGHGDDTFRPNDNITREQLAMIFYNYARYKGYDVSATDDLSGFTDAGDVSGWALPAMRWAVGSGIMGGYGDGILGPQGTATRAQVAAMLHRFIENNKLVPPTVAPGGDSGTTGTGGTGSGGGGWTQQTTSPQTGDSSNIGLWISLCALSLAGLVGTSIWYAARRRRYETEASSHPLIP